METNLPAATIKTIQKYRKEGMTIKVIAKQLHISDKRVAPIVKQFEAKVEKEGLPDKIPESSDKTLAKMQEMRKNGKSIKDIARSLHISDRKVSGYFNVVGDPKKLNDDFQKFCSKVAMYEESTGRDFIAALNKGMLEQVEGLLKSKQPSKKEIEESTKKILDENVDAFLDAAFISGLAAFWLMPVKYKRLWLENVNTEPKTCLPIVTNKKEE